MAKVNIKLEAQLKAEFEAFCSELGLTMTDALTIFATKVVHDWQVPFALALPQSGTEAPTVVPANTKQPASLTASTSGRQTDLN